MRDLTEGDVRVASGITAPTNALTTWSGITDLLRQTS